MDTQKKLVVVIEDEFPLRVALMDDLTRAGFSVLGAKDGESGLTLVMEKHPDLILLDVMLSGISGLELLKILRKDEWGKTVPVMILTNVSDSEKVALAMEQQSFEYLVKSDVKIGEIVSKVKERLGL